MTSQALVPAAPGVRTAAVRTESQTTGFATTDNAVLGFPRNCSPRILQDQKGDGMKVSSTTVSLVKTPSESERLYRSSSHPIPVSGHSQNAHFASMHSFPKALKT